MMQSLHGDETTSMDLKKTVDEVVCNVKSEGLFDQFRKECLEHFENMNAYQSLKQRVENHVALFLSKHKYHSSLSKNGLRDSLRNHISKSDILLIGVQKLVDDVLNLKAQSFCERIDTQVDKFFMARQQVEINASLGAEVPATVVETSCSFQSLPTEGPGVGTSISEVDCADERTSWEVVTDMDIEEVEMDVDDKDVIEEHVDACQGQVREPSLQNDVCDQSLPNNEKSNDSHAKEIEECLSSDSSANIELPQRANDCVEVHANESEADSPSSNSYAEKENFEKSPSKIEEYYSENVENDEGDQTLSLCPAVDVSEASTADLDLVGLSEDRIPERRSKRAPVKSWKIKEMEELSCHVPQDCNDGLRPDQGPSETCSVSKRGRPSKKSRLGTRDDLDMLVTRNELESQQREADISPSVNIKFDTFTLSAKTSGNSTSAMSSRKIKKIVTLEEMISDIGRKSISSPASTSPSDSPKEETGRRSKSGRPVRARQMYSP